MENALLWMKTLGYPEFGSILHRKDPESLESDAGGVENEFVRSAPRSRIALPAPAIPPQ